MNTVSIVRRLDNLGRVVIPKDIRDRFGIAAETRLEFLTDGKVVGMVKADASCVFCGTGTDLTEFRGRKICGGCWQAVAQPGR